MMLRRWACRRASMPGAGRLAAADAFFVYVDAEATLSSWPA